MAVYLKNATYIDWRDGTITSGNLRVEEGIEDGIKFIDKCPQEALDCSGKIVTRSFVNAHHHVYSALARGMPFPKQTPQSFYEILQYIWWNLDKKLDAEMIRASALVTAMQCAGNGVTFVIDHHASPNAVSGSLEIIADAFDEVGIGHLLCCELSDRDGASSRDAGLRETEKYLQMRPGLVGLHASFTVGDELLQQAVQLAGRYDSGIHIHVAEDVVDQQRCEKEYGMRVVERLKKAGVLDFPKTILAHAIHLNENERGILKNSPAWIAVNTESNLNNEVGLFDGRGVNEGRIMLGTDGMHSDMLQSARTHYFTHKRHEKLTPLTAYRRLRGGHDFLRQNGFAGDGENNLIILNYNAPTPVSAENWAGHFFYGLSSAHIESVIARGKFIIRDRSIQTVNEQQILEEAKKQAGRLWKLL